MKKTLLGNEAIAWGLLYAGVDVMAAYPGTPSSEILETYQKIVKQKNLSAYAEWSTNEKVAFETAYAAAITGKRAACGMKMVGLNVASDALMSSAYIGNKGGFLIISADDPGFYSSQTEQDSRYFAKFARIPALDPSSPEDAFRLTVIGVNLSEKFEIPVILRPVLRVCHGRQIVDIPDFEFEGREGKFERNIERWAAVPRIPRLKQGYELLEKLQRIAQFNYDEFLKPQVEKLRGGKLLIIASGTSYSYVLEVLEDTGLKADVLKIDMPTPLPSGRLSDLISSYEEVIVFEETYPLIEEQIKHLGNVRGKLSGDVFQIDEVAHDRVADILLKRGHISRNVYVGKEYEGEVPPRVPALCPGCPHRTVFYGMKKVFGNKAIYPSDIGCYTLGLNQKAVDTVLCMGASVGLSCGFSKSDTKKPIVATIGDSTFLHAGIPPLIDAVANRHKFVLVIMDNSTVAMTGLQPTPERIGNVSIPKIVEGCGVKPLILDYDGTIKTTVEFFKKVKEIYEKANGPVVAIVNEFCTFDKEKVKLPGKFAKVDQDKCTGCGHCINDFGCPAFEWNDEGKVEVNPYFCVGCGVCLSDLCPFDAFVEDVR
ncbi:Indolepyruvate ferredoxin oxidoreductase [Desulfurobacterium thermolithotrophum DSM 11699]|uniref:Indolepyruvate oxidoreductase subunit IorA n=1 Tax=Desulfurobacterium thermolithotrophum (strain DSM 11699 / BSA) TaxID=868864 RepID=F0S279_DESTD|nr:thiamine pyrophosphate-dependent enzyme [Desulfurobacterium thermolithotrophum]ADY73022.1 Indolepyruvate ferredoxin oxidoreductase [Desulfurobacterium thermolithotrophum DSM 11699]